MGDGSTRELVNGFDMDLSGAFLNDAGHALSGLDGRLAQAFAYGLYKDAL